METHNSQITFKILDRTTTLSKDQIKNIIKSDNEHDFQVYTALRTKGRMTRTQLMKETGIARSTLFNALERLILKKLAFKYSEALDGPGRPQVYFTLKK